MSGLRKLRRSVKKAQGQSLRSGPAKASDGSEKGPARSPTLVEARRFAREQARLAAALEAQNAKASKAA